MSSNPDAPSDSRITASLSLILTAVKMINIHRGTVRLDNSALSSLWSLATDAVSA